MQWVGMWISVSYNISLEPKSNVLPYIISNSKILLSITIQPPYLRQHVCYDRDLITCASHSQHMYVGKHCHMQCGRTLEPLFINTRAWFSRHELPDSFTFPCIIQINFRWGFMNDFTHHSENYVLDGKQKGNIFVILEAIRVSNVSRVFFSDDEPESVC